jgi:hypothetical protein
MEIDTMTGIEKKLTLLAIIVLPLLLLVACGGTSPTGEVNTKHVINLSLAQDAASQQVYAYLTVSRDGQPFNLAAVAVYNTVDSNAAAILNRTGDGIYSKTFPSYQIDSTRQLLTELNSAIDDFQFRYLQGMPDTFSFSVDGLPDNIVRSSTGTVHISWNASRYADGYFAVLEPASPANEAVGFHGFLSSGTTSDAIPIEAFQSTEGFQTGTYYLWVVAYQGEPIDNPSLPFTLPVGFTDNIKRTGVTGRGGSMYIPVKTVLSAQTE